jgi:exonuclease SbcD
MRVLHTADWHLGHTLREHSRAAEHAHFLAWLVRTVADREVDALLIAGDVFDGANPQAAAWRQWFDFLGALKLARPSVQVVVIAGNHDSAARLEAPRDLLAAFDVRVVGSMKRAADGALAVDELLVPLRDATGATAAWCVALPFLRSGDILALAAPATANAANAVAATATSTADVLPRPGAAAEAPHDLDLIDGLRRLHGELFAAARQRRQPGQALLAMAHGYLVGGALSELSERKVLGGNQHALPLDLFPPDCDYVALGHLHRPQALGGHEHVRYCGSPIPLSMPERLHAHHVVFADFAHGALAKVWSLRVPRLVPLVRLPEHGWLDPEAALAAVAALPARDPQQPDGERPLLEVGVQLPRPAPNIGERIARAAADKNVRLVRVEVVATGDAATGAAPQAIELQSLTPEQVFLRRYQRSHRDPIPAPLLAAFRELLDEVQHGGPA